MAERYSYGKIFIALAWLAEVIGLPSGLGGVMTTLLMDLPHSRTQEYEGLCLLLFLLAKRCCGSNKRCYLPVADKLGLKLSAKACFDPTAAPEYASSRFVSYFMTTCCLHWVRIHPGCSNASARSRSRVAA